MSTISIIVPVYKVEKTLSRCIDSILSQTFKDFELILIDDGSPDNCPKICDEYAKKDSRIQVYHKENGGVSSARNLGLDYAAGKWVSFVDSDDWVENDYILNLYNSLDADFKGLVTAGRVNEYSDHITKKIWDYGIFSVSDLNIILEKYDLINHGFPWGRLYELDTIKDNQLRFNTNISHAEDLLFLLQYLKCVKKIKFISATDYHYQCDNVLSLSNRYSSFDEELYAFREIRREFIELLEKNKVDINKLSRSLNLLSETGLRAIKSQYRGFYKLSSTARLYNLRNKIDQFDIDFFSICFKCTNIHNRIIVRLLKKHKILLDLYLTMFYKIHK